ncbi:MAG: DUF4249 family protein, partial [Lewinella sp.]|nr:DUF4249 family protein [Lewinella sp.]
FPLPEQDQSQTIAIRGALVASDTARVSIWITRLTNFVRFEIPEKIAGATVWLADELGNRLDIPMQEPGLYALKDINRTNNFRVEPGKSYRLYVFTPDGKRYRSSVETLFPVPVPTAVKQELGRRKVADESGDLVDQEFLRFLFSTPLVHPDYQGKAFLKWQLQGCYRFRGANFTRPFPPNVRTCYFFDDLRRDEVVVYNGAENSADTLRDYFLLEEPFNYRFSGGFYLSIFQQSLSESAYCYWKNVGAVVDQSGDFFDAPPGRITGNFQNISDEAEVVYGYFYVTQETVFRYYIPPVLDRVAPYCPTTISDPNFIPAICSDCLIQPGSTLEKPDFWMD